MLRSLTDRLDIYLHPERIVMMRQSGVFRKSVQKKQVYALNPSVDNTSWLALISKLSTLLEQDEWKGLRTHILLSSHFVRYRVSPWHEQLTMEERSALIKHQLNEVYGENAAAWDVFISNTGFKKNELACAVDLNFLEALKALFSLTPSTLASIKPYLVMTINKWHKKVNPNALVMIIEDGLISFVRLADGGWDSIRSKPINNVKEDIVMLFDREMLHSEKEYPDAESYFIWAQHPAFKPDLNLSGKKLSMTVLNELSTFAQAAEKDITVV